LRLAFRKPFGVFEIPSVYEGFHEGGKTSSAPLKSRVPYRCPEAESNRHVRNHLLVRSRPHPSEVSRSLALACHSSRLDYYPLHVR
jgi:hypothetical protein